MTEKNKTILGFDYGTSRIGVARVSSVAKLPQPLGVIGPNDKDALEALIDEHRPTDLVVGLPRTLDGSDSEQTKLCRAFAESLQKFGLPVHLQDEALTSVEAEERAKSYKKPVSIDALSAVIILEDYLKEANL